MRRLTTIPLATLGALAALAALAACHHRAPAGEARLERLPDEHCWWTARRTTLPADSVAARFVLAFDALGLRPLYRARVGDTVTVASAPVPRAGWTPGARWQARLVAFPKGDSTRFRYYVGVAPDTARPLDEGTGGHIGLCGEVARLAGLRTTAPGAPTAEDSAAVWGRWPR